MWRFKRSATTPKHEPNREGAKTWLLGPTDADFGRLEHWNPDGTPGEYIDLWFREYLYLKTRLARNRNCPVTELVRDDIRNPSTDIQAYAHDTLTLWSSIGVWEERFQLSSSEAHFLKMALAKARRCGLHELGERNDSALPRLYRLMSTE
jgi:hypothetical protein